MNLKDMKIYGVVVVVTASLLLTACDNNDADKVKGDHFLKDQTEMIDKAKALEGMMQDHVQQEMREADAQSQ